MLTTSNDSFSSWQQLLKFVATFNLKLHIHTFLTKNGSLLHCIWTNVPSHEFLTWNSNYYKLIYITFNFLIIFPYFINNKKNSFSLEHTNVPYIDELTWVILSSILAQRHIIVLIGLFIIHSFSPKNYLFKIHNVDYFLIFFGKHNNIPNLTSHWHPQIKLVGKGPIRVSPTLHTTYLFIYKSFQKSFILNFLKNSVWNVKI